MSLVSIDDLPFFIATHRLTNQPVRQFSYDIGHVGPYEVQPVGLKNAYVGNTGDKTIIYHRPGDGHRAMVLAGEDAANRIFVGDLLLSVTQHEIVFEQVTFSPPGGELLPRDDRHDHPNAAWSRAALEPRSDKCGFGHVFVGPGSLVAVQVDVLEGGNDENSAVIVLDWSKGLAVKLAGLWELDPIWLDKGAFVLIYEPMIPLDVDG